jgi:hypothetical protein
MSLCTPKNWICGFSMLVFSCLALVARGASADPVLEVTVGGQTRHFDRDELLRRPDVAQIQIASDVAYGKVMSYRAVPLAALLSGLDAPAVA